MLLCLLTTDNPSIQAYWSALCDALFYIASNMMDLDGRMVMGFVLYCSHENNGTFLPAGRIFSHLKTVDKRIHFKKSVDERGMYATFVRKNLDLMFRNKKSQYSAS